MQRYNVVNPRTGCGRQALDQLGFCKQAKTVFGQRCVRADRDQQAGDAVINDFGKAAGAGGASANSPFTATPSGSSLTGGSDPQPPPGAYSLSSVSYAPDGDLLSSTDSANGSFSFGYDDLNQLVSAACSSSPCTGESASYAYDRYGNRWSEAGTLPAAAPAALSFSGSSNRISGWSYDADGNLLSDGVHSYQYDAENRLISVDNGSTASYIYGPEGNRVYEDVGGVVKEFVYGDGAQRLAVTSASVKGQPEQVLTAEDYLGGHYLGTQTPSAFVYPECDPGRGSWGPVGRLCSV